MGRQFEHKHSTVKKDTTRLPLLTGSSHMQTPVGTQLQKSPGGQMQLPLGYSSPRPGLSVVAIPVSESAKCGSDEPIT